MKLLLEEVALQGVKMALVLLKHLTVSDDIDKTSVHLLRNLFFDVELLNFHKF